MDRESRENSHSREKRVKYKKIDKFEKLTKVSFFFCSIFYIAEESNNLTNNILMSKINSHPIRDVPKRDKVVFTFNGKKIEGESGYTIAAALHQAGYPVHSHSIDGRATEQRARSHGTG